MKYEFVSESGQDWPVAVMCETLEVSRSGYYDYVRTQPTTHDLELLTRINPTTTFIVDPSRISSYAAPVYHPSG